jgi:hypothetical protein
MTVVIASLFIVCFRFWEDLTVATLALRAHPSSSEDESSPYAANMARPAGALGWAAADADAEGGGASPGGAATGAPEAAGAAAGTLAYCASVLGYAPGAPSPSTAVARYCARATACCCCCCCCSACAGATRARFAGGWPPRASPARWGAATVPSGSMPSATWPARIARSLRRCSQRRCFGFGSSVAHRMLSTAAPPPPPPPPPPRTQSAAPAAAARFPSSAPPLPLRRPPAPRRPPPPLGAAP